MKLTERLRSLDNATVLLCSDKAANRIEELEAALLNCRDWFQNRIDGKAIGGSTSSMIAQIEQAMKETK